MWELVFNDPEIPKFIVIVSETQDQACNFLATIQANLEDNPRIHKLFGNLVGSKWTQTDFITANNVRVKALGSGQKIRGIYHLGMRPNVIVIDDFESESNTGTAEQRHKNMDWAVGAVEPSLADDGVLTLLGTVAHQATYLTAAQKDAERPGSPWTCRFYQAIQDGKPLWPERFPMERLNEIRETLRAQGLIHKFYQEWMNEPRNPEEQTFIGEDFKYWEGEISQREGYSFIRIRPEKEGGAIIEKPVNVYVGVDLAISSRGDYSVIMPLAVDAQEQMYVGDYYRARVEPDILIGELFKINKQLAPAMFIIETTAYQQALVSFLRREMNRSGIYFPVREVKPRLQKDIRLEGLQPYFRAGKIRHKRRHTALETELLAFPKGKNDDVIDALHNAVSHASRSIRDTVVPVESELYGEQLGWRKQ